MQSKNQTERTAVINFLETITGNTETVMFLVLTKTPKNIIEVAGGVSFSGEDSRPRAPSKSSI